MITAGTAVQNIAIRGRNCIFAGEPGDAYFDQLPAFSQGKGERQLAQYAARHLSADSVCLDIGANIGLTALILSSYCPRGHVFAFEPSPTNAKYLRQNISNNGISNVTVIEAAVGASPGSAQLALVDIGANSTIVRPDAAAPLRAADVKVISLDTWAVGDYSEVDFIKLDVEGYEGHVLAGAAGLIARARPPIFMEFNSVTIVFEARRSPLSFAETIWQAFDIYSVGAEGELQPAGDGSMEVFVFQNMVQNGCIDDVILIPKPSIDAARLAEILQRGIE